MYQRHKIVVFSHMMYTSRSTNNKYLAIVMVVLLSLSCPMKREIKQWLQIDTTQQTMKSSCPRTCYIYLYDNILTGFAGKHGEEKRLLPFSLFKKYIDKFALLNNVYLRRFSISPKQKIPSFLLFRKLLI